MNTALVINGYTTEKSSNYKTRTKFGGQPDWLESPQWPLSRESGKHLRFIGQIDLSEAVYDPFKLHNKMAYIFMLVVVILQ